MAPASVDDGPPGGDGVGPPDGDGIAPTPVDASAALDGHTVRVELDGETHELPRERAVALCDALSAALTERREWLHTACEHRADGSYVVERRGADSAGHRKVFDQFSQLERRFDRLPREFTAEDLTGDGVSGGRRHMLLWHLVEHPAFDCELTGRQPLSARKTEQAEGCD